MQMCEVVSNRKVAENPHFINSLDRTNYHPLNSKYCHIPMSLKKPTIVNSCRKNNIVFMLNSIFFYFDFHHKIQ